MLYLCFICAHHVPTCLVFWKVEKIMDEYSIVGVHSTGDRDYMVTWAFRLAVIGTIHIYLHQYLLNKKQVNKGIRIFSLDGMAIVLTSTQQVHGFCVHGELLQAIKWTNPYMLEVRTPWQLVEEEPISFVATCKWQFSHYSRPLWGRICPQAKFEEFEAIFFFWEIITDFWNKCLKSTYLRGVGAKVHPLYMGDCKHFPHKNLQKSSLWLVPPLSSFSRSLASRLAP